jgi:hypothetical protein
LKEPAQITELDKYLDQHHKVMTHVFDKLPASRLAESAKTYHEKDKSKLKPVKRDEFKKQILLKKWGRYTHRYWSGVSEIERR